ncbi:MAG: hypothetical protein HQK76_06980 [Desulfobacterales bacterium]|nr:hypothetical protein [Desulfobacterales bacterium]
MTFKLNVSSKSAEKRVLAQFPKLEDLKKGTRDYLSQVEKYYNDNFGLRNLLVSWNNIILTRFFTSTFSKNVILGKEGWLFYKDSVDYYRCNNIPSDKEILKIVGILKKRQKWLKDNGMEYFFFVAPSKTTVYPEYLPDYLQKNCEESMLEKLMALIKKNSDIRTVDLRVPLLKAKKEKRVFRQTDTHWNDTGAFIAYNEIIKFFYGTNPINYSDLNIINATVNDGDLADMLSLKDEFFEQVEYLVPKTNFSAEIAEISPALKDFLLVNINDNLEKANVIDDTKYKWIMTKVKNDLDSPSVLVFCDSFVLGTKLKDFLSEHFAKTKIIMGASDFFDKELVEKEKPNIVIQEIVERYLVNAFQNFSEIVNPKDLEKKENLIFSLGLMNNFSLIKPVNNVKISEITKDSNRLLLVDAIGNDPGFMLPVMNYQENKFLLIKITIDSPEPTNLQIFYKTKKNKNYCKENCAIELIKKGENNLYIFIEDIDIWDKIRIDPGDALGQYIISLIEVYVCDILMLD